MEECYQASLKGDRARADACFVEAVGLDPKGYGYHVSYGWALCNLGDYAAALQIWQQGFKGPDKAYWNRAVCQALAHYQLGHKETAVEWYHLQRLGNVEWGSLGDLRVLTSYWREPEKHAIEDLYKLWVRTESRASKLLPKLQPKARALADYQAIFPDDPALAEYEFKIQSRIDQLFARELKSLRLVIRTDKRIRLQIVISPERKLTTTAGQLESIAFTEPLFAKAALQTLGSLAESIEAPPVARDGATRNVSLLAVFEVQPLAPDNS